jgi:hypothetical protein
MTVVTARDIVCSLGDSHPGIQEVQLLRGHSWKRESAGNDWRLGNNVPESIFLSVY